MCSVHGCGGVELANHCPPTATSPSLLVMMMVFSFYSTSRAAGHTLCAFLSGVCLRERYKIAFALFRHSHTHTHTHIDTAKSLLHQQNVGVAAEVKIGTRFLTH